MLREVEAPLDSSKAGAALLLGHMVNSAEPGALRLVRTACKAFEKHGSKKTGEMVEFSEFARTKGIDCLPLTSYRGNRFNVIFYDAAGVFFGRCDEPLFQGV